MVNYSCFQSPPQENRCHLVVAKNRITVENKSETKLLKYTAIISDVSEFVFIASTLIHEEIFSIFYHSEFIYVGVQARVLVFDPNSLQLTTEISLEEKSKFNIPYVNALHFEGNILCVGCSDASIQFFTLEANGFNFKHTIVSPSSIIPNSFNYSEGTLYFATLAGYIGQVLLIGFTIEYYPTNEDIDALAIYGDQMYIAVKDRIIVYKKQPSYEISEQLITKLSNERVVSLYVAFPFIYFLTDLGVCYRCDPTSATRGSFTVIKMDKEYTIDHQTTELMPQEENQFSVECVGNVQVDNCYACVAVSEYGKVNSAVAPLE